MESPVLQRAWYTATFSEFLAASQDAIVGSIARNAGYAVLHTQDDAWREQIIMLQPALKGLSGSIYFEFNVPRVGSRIDVVLIIASVVIVLEFKTGESIFEQPAIDQVWDYALDLKYFHEASHAVAIVPVLVATGMETSQSMVLRCDEDKLYRPVLVHPQGLRSALNEIINTVQGNALCAQDWAAAPYRPTPTIIEAARALYAQHSVEAIARYDAGAKNLRVTSSRVEEVIEDARARNRKVICFVTGVPGAGKTLVGLNIATHRRDIKEPTHAVFLSGNGPLVAVLQEALTRDEVQRLKKHGLKKRKGEVKKQVKAFIQNVHHFRDEALRDSRAPSEHVAIFDEAQRAWNLRQTVSFMQRKKKVAGFNASEPKFLIQYMDRHTDWAAIICLVGGGQEINTGEAGIDEWLSAITSNFPHWEMYISNRLHDSEYAAGNALDAVRHLTQTHFEEHLHLAVSMRSFRAENVSGFVKALLDCEFASARATFAALAKKYPISITRSLDLAKDWIRSRARGSERYGLITSSKAQRLKPHAIDVRVDVNPVHYFLNDRSDTRSSYYLEDAATEFQVQGLELDWACVTWDGDLRFDVDGWSFHDFRGSRWCNINSVENRRYLLNAYRVLLTRARQGMVIFVPPGEPRDPTRAPAIYDPTFALLKGIGIPELS